MLNVLGAAFSHYASRGTETFVVTNWSYKTQVKWKWDNIGESGKHYTWSYVRNYFWKNFVPGKTYNETGVSINIIECEGVPIAIYKVRFHITINANGELDKATFPEIKANTVT